MSQRAYVLVLCTIGLVGLVAWDYWTKASPAPALQTSATLPQTVALLNPLAQRDMGDFQALFDHPLFSVSRAKPVVIDTTPDLEAQIVPLDASAPEMLTGPEQSVLIGTITTPWPGGAYLSDRPEGQVVFLRPGEGAFGLNLELVHSDTAIFDGPDGKVTLTLQLVQRSEPRSTPVDLSSADISLSSP